MDEMFTALGIGLAVAVVVILVLLTAYFQSPRLALISVGAVPGVLGGVVTILLPDRHDAEHRVVHGLDHVHRRVGVELRDAGDVHRPSTGGAARPRPRPPSRGAGERLRPILMTACAMTVGMVPMALALEQRQPDAGAAGPGGDRRPGLSTFATLLVVPSIFALRDGPQVARSPSLHPDDPESAHYDPQVYAHVDELTKEVKPRRRLRGVGRGRSRHRTGPARARPEMHIASGPAHEVPPPRGPDTPGLTAVTTQGRGRRTAALGFPASRPAGGRRSSLLRTPRRAGRRVPPPPRAPRKP